MALKKLKTFARRLSFSKKKAKIIIAIGAMSLVSACSNFSFGPDIGTSNISNFPQQSFNQILPNASGEIIGSGEVRVALLLPLSGSAGLSSVGISMANGAKLAMDFINNNPSIASNITLVIKDTKGDANIASNLATQAVNEGASLILGPLKAQNVIAAGNVAKAANIPLIGFSNNSSAASNGVYLLNVLPKSELRRSLSYARSKGSISFVAITSTNDFGQIQRNAFNSASLELGLNVVGSYSFSNEDEARNAVQTIIPLIQSGQVDTLFLPDRATAPSIAILLEAAGIDRTKLRIIGSADWENDLNIAQTPFLIGAIFPAIDDAGHLALRPQYNAKYGSSPHPFATITYTATLLANSSTLSKSTPRYDRAILTRNSGFKGRDGLFRFLVNGQSEYALIIKSVANGGSIRVDGPRLP